MQTLISKLKLIQNSKYLIHKRIEMLNLFHFVTTQRAIQTNANCDRNKKKSLPNRDVLKHVGPNYNPFYYIVPFQEFYIIILINRDIDLSYMYAQ